MDDTAEPGAGTHARGPGSIPAAGWREALVRAWKDAGEDDVSLISAGVAFYAFLAFVPLLGAVVLTYGLVADPATVADHVGRLTRMMPADAAKVIGEQLQATVHTASSKKGFGLLVALLISLYGAMKGAGAIVTALTTVYDEEETRGFVRLALLQATLTAGGLVALLLAILGISTVGFIETLLPFASPAIHLLLQALYWIGTALAVSFGLALVYRYAPDRPKPRWRWLTPGSLAATVVWLVGTFGFSLYVADFGNYNATYGSLGAVVVLLTWLYLSAYIVLLGGELNQAIERQAERKSG